MGVNSIALNKAGDITVNGFDKLNELEVYDATQMQVDTVDSTGKHETLTYKVTVEPNGSFQFEFKSDSYFYWFFGLFFDVVSDVEPSKYSSMLGKHFTINKPFKVYSLVQTSEKPLFDNLTILCAAASKLAYSPHLKFQVTDQLDEVDLLPFVPDVNKKAFKDLLAEVRKAGVYYKLFKVIGTCESYIMAFRGTVTIGDWATDIAQAIKMETDAYDGAMKLATYVSALLRDCQLTFTGHSLGGGFTCCACLVTGQEGITFNPAGVSDDTLEEFLNIEEESAEKLLKSKANELINAYEVENEALGILQDLPFIPHGNGSIQMLKANREHSSVQRHYMDNVLGAMKVTLKTS